MDTLRPCSPLDVVVLVSGSGTLLQALLDHIATGGSAVRVVAVGSDRHGIEGLARAERSGVATFVVPVAAGRPREEWDARLAEEIARHRPRLVVSAGFMRILGPAALGLAPVLNTHPALLPSFPGAHAVRDALAHGVRVTGTTLHVVDAGIDTGPILDQRAVEVRDDDDEGSLHERIKAVERVMLVEGLERAAREGLVVAGRSARFGGLPPALGSD